MFTEAHLAFAASSRQATHFTGKVPQMCDSSLRENSQTQGQLTQRALSPSVSLAPFLLSTNLHLPKKIVFHSLFPSFFFFSVPVANKENVVYEDQSLPLYHSCRFSNNTQPCANKSQCTHTNTHTPLLAEAFT